MGRPYSVQNTFAVHADEFHRSHQVLETMIFTRFRVRSRPGTEESLPAELLDLTVTLAEYNGNAHGPELMRCTPQGQNFSCLRVQKALVTENQAQSPGQQGQQGQQGKQGQQGQQQRSVQTPGEIHGMHGMGHMQGMHEQMQHAGHAGHARPGDASGASGLRQAMPMAAPLALGDVCMPGRSRCPGGSYCKAYDFAAFHPASFWTVEVYPFRALLWQFDS